MKIMMTSRMFYAALMHAVMHPRSETVRLYSLHKPWGTPQRQRRGSHRVKLVGGKGLRP